MHRVCVALGTRPEAIKMAPVIQELRRYPELIEVKIMLTAQHREMLDQMLQGFHLSADEDLNLMAPDQTLHDLTANVIIGTTRVLKKIQPDIVLVQGDTTTTFGVALAAFYLKIPVGHVEAGLRTYDPFNPFPEEINRRLTSVLTNMHFAPTASSKQNLVREGVNPARIRVTGNTVIDALLATVRDDYDFTGTPVAAIPATRRWVLVTAHRRENFGQPIRNICNALKVLAESDEIEIIYPVHPNPHVRDVAYSMLQGIANVHLLPPLPYEVVAQVMNRSVLCLTDSGGIQEEAPSLGKPVLVMRDVTERPEALVAGTVALVGSDTERILKETRRLLRDSEAYAAMANRVNPYGDGKAARRIVSVLLHEFGLCATEEAQFLWQRFPTP